MALGKECQVLMGQMFLNEEELKEGKNLLFQTNLILGDNLLI